MKNQGTPITHDQLVDAAYLWLTKTQKCSFAFKELRSFALSGEQPDCFGFKNSLPGTILCECKASRADFLADAKKKFRKNPELGAGSYRFYVCPPGLITVEDLPPSWGLVYVNPKTKKPRMIHGPKGNAWGFYGKEFLFTERNLDTEYMMMATALRRLNLRGHFPDIYKGVIVNNGANNEQEVQK